MSQEVEMPGGFIDLTTSSTSSPERDSTAAGADSSRRRRGAHFQRSDQSRHPASQASPPTSADATGMASILNPVWLEQSRSDLPRSHRRGHRASRNERPQRPVTASSSQHQLSRPAGPVNLRALAHGNYEINVALVPQRRRPGQNVGPVIWVVVARISANGRLSYHVSSYDIDGQFIGVWNWRHPRRNEIAVGEINRTGRWLGVFRQDGHEAVQRRFQARQAAGVIDLNERDSSVEMIDLNRDESEERIMISDDD